MTGSAFIMGILLGFMIAMFATADAVNEHWRREICNKGYAQYTTDPTTGVTTWDWKK